MSKIRTALSVSVLAVTMSALTATPASADDPASKPKSVTTCKTKANVKVCLTVHKATNVIKATVSYSKSTKYCVNGELVIFRPKHKSFASSGNFNLGNTKCSTNGSSATKFKSISGKGIGKGQYIASFRVGGDMFAELSAVSYTWS
ncbi:hypothetical protein ACGFNP_22435 [Nonomuraea sp. NPDC049269]|uniref:hypothetical protein n=1 Tax=Nonomuraea sp. NPDC049269 TaxID=3364349 RepID=UPI003718E036